MLKLRFLYTIALWLLLPYAFLRLLWRARRQPEYLQHIGERFGLYSITCSKPVIWLHAVSVGETRAAQTLVNRLRITYPRHQILLTHTTPTGRAASRQLYGDSVVSAYLPYDYPFAVNRFLRHFKPQLGILMETEIWFNLIQICHETAVPLLLLNARMSARSSRNYSRFSKLVGNALGELAAVAAQTADDAERLTDLGAMNVSVTGNLKFDIEPPAAMLELGMQLRRRFGTGRNVLLAASTRDGEEALLLDALKQAYIPGLLLVIVPRHPQRFAEVAALLEQRGISFWRRSELEEAGFPRTVPEEIMVVLGDSMGEMFAYYAASDLAFIGGSLLPYGGQNLIEACAAGAPVLVGKHTYNFTEATRLAVAAGAAVQVHDTESLPIELQRLMNNRESLREMHRHCAGFVESNRGATEKTLKIILSLGIGKAA